MTRGTWLGSVLIVVVTGVVAKADIVWRSWSAASRALAQRDGKPIALLITEGTCRACVAVERGTNIGGAFVPIVLDRNERPRIAAAYLAFAEAAIGVPVELPVIVVMTPQLEPLTAMGHATPETALTFLASAASRWNGPRDEMIAEAGLLVRRKLLEKWWPTPRVTPASRAVAVSVAFRDPNERTRNAALEELRSISKTATYDQLGGGLFRAARDEAWRVPEFEKLLRDQALVLIAYTEAWQITGDARMSEVARATAEVMIRELRDPKTSLFYGGLGSHSLIPRRGGEWADGGHYVWDAEEIRHLLGAETADLFMPAYGVENEGNVPNQFDRTGDLKGKNVLFVGDATMPNEQLDRLRPARDRLFEVRANRPPPERDEAVLTSDNALAISALARAGNAFDEARYGEAATRAAKALVARHYDASRKLLYATKRAAPAALVEASLIDYALLVQALIDAYESSFDASLFERAIEIQRRQDAILSSAETLSYDVDDGVPAVMAGFAPPDDSLIVTGRNLVRLGYVLRDDSWIARGAALAGGKVAPQKHVILAGDRRTEDMQSLLRVVRGMLWPNVTVFLVDSKQTRTALVNLAAGAKGVPECKPGRYGMTIQVDASGRCAAVAIVCYGATCGTPMVDPEALRAAID